MNYYNNSTDINKKTPRISQYALGEDYHLVLKQKLAELLEFIQENSGAVGARMFVDSGPVLERAWAARSGTGWIGKNGMLLNREQGSFFFLAEIILDLELEYDSPMADFCGTCRACLDACPTQAILPDKQIDGSRCISYLTIELKNELPAWASNQLHGWMFGCDVCQDVCPWNRFAKPHSMENFFPSERLKKMKSSDWYELTREIYEEISRKSAMKRAKFSGLKRNLAALQWEEIQPRQSQ
jgi:epoxyqueuosine reductase